MKIAIVGAGKLGIKIAEALSSGDNQVTLLDHDADVIQKINSQMDILTIVANGLQLDAYEEIGIKSYDYLVALTDSDEKNILICSLIKKMGCKKVVARVRDPEYMDQLDFVKASLDIDFIINPDRLISLEIYRYLVNRYKSCNEFFTGPTIGMLEFNSSSLPVIINQKISNAVTILDNLLIVAISRNGKIIIPSSSTTILSDDTLYVLGKRITIRKLSGIVTDSDVNSGIKKVMIIGGGKTGYYLGQLLSEAKISVKIIEKRRERCEYLSAKLNDVLILHGDATDITLLEEENASGMDAFITVTGYDEDNLLLALLAKQLGVNEVVAKVSRTSYNHLVEMLGINATLNPLDITSSFILRIIQGNDFVTASLLLQGQAEIIEIIANKKMRITGKNISEMHLPEGVMIGLISRNGESIVPDGYTEILDGDKVIIFCLLSAVPALERILQIGKDNLPLRL